MAKKLHIILLTIAFLLSTNAVHANNVNDHKQYKDASVQKIKANKWQDLKFDGKGKTIKGNGNRSLWCIQANVSMKGKNPSYVKLRFARHLPSGKIDTTGTSTFVVGGNGMTAFYESTCWEFKSNYPVSAQIKVVGKKKYYYSEMRQFKMWTPGADYPEDFPVNIADPFPTSTP
jgi:hypothetical protein